MELSDKDLKDESSLKQWLKKNKLTIEENKTKKIKLSKGLYIYVSKLKSGNYNYKFKFRTTIKGKQKDILLQSILYSSAVQEKENYKDSFDRDVVSINSIWDEIVKTSKFQSLAVKTQNYLSFYFKKFFISEIAEIKNHQLNLMDLTTESAFTYLNTIITQKTVPIIDRCTNILGKIIAHAETKYNKFIEVDLKKVNQKLKCGISHQVKHHETFTGYKRNLAELENNIIEFYKTIDKSKVYKQNKLAIDLLLYSCLRKSELLSITTNDLHLNESEANYIHIKETKTIKNGTGFNVPVSESMKLNLIKAIELNKNKERLFNATPRSLNVTLDYINGHLDPNNIIGDVKRTSVHGFRSLAREFFNLNEDKVSFKTAENCLSHKVGNQVTNSYLRDQLQGLPQDRINAMQLWSDFLDNCKLKANSKLATRNILKQLKVV